MRAISLTFQFLASTVLVGLPLFAAEPLLERHSLFEAGKDDYAVYRIPLFQHSQFLLLWLWRHYANHRPSQNGDVAGSRDSLHDGDLLDFRFRQHEGFDEASAVTRSSGSALEFKTTLYLKQLGPFDQSVSNAIYFGDPSRRWLRERNMNRKQNVEICELHATFAERMATKVDVIRLAPFRSVIDRTILITFEWRNTKR